MTAGEDTVLNVWQAGIVSNLKRKVMVDDGRMVASKCCNAWLFVYTGFINFYLSTLYLKMRLKHFAYTSALVKNSLDN